MFTPVLNPNSSSSIKTNTNSTLSASQIHMELGKILRRHDPNAIRLYDFINHVKVFLYNSNEHRWANNSYIEGNLFFYKRQEIINNQTYPSYAFAIINGQQNLIQQITSDMAHQAEKLRLFYEVVRNEKHEVFCLYFLNENECLRLNKFINQSIQNIKEQQSRVVATGELHSIPRNGQTTPADAYRQQTTVNIPNSTAAQFGSSQQTLTRLSAQQSTSVINDSNNTNDPTSSLKRLLNIPSQNSFDNVSILSQQQTSINLIPPSAFQSMLATSPSSMDGEHNKNCLSQIYPSLNREYFRNVLLDLIQNNDHFLDIIHQACVNYPSQ